MPTTHPKALIETLARAPEIIVPLVFELPENLRKRRPASGKWSAHEHAVHLPTVHPLFFRRLDQMLKNPGATIVPYNPDKDESDAERLEKDLAVEMEHFTQDRAKLVAQLKKLTPEQWAITAQHPEYSHYSMLIMFRHLAMHDYLHGYRIEELVLQKDW